MHDAPSPHPRHSTPSALSARASALHPSAGQASSAPRVRDDGKSQWTKNLEANPGHTAWFIQRWETMKARGDDLDGEARFVDALLPRGARVFDAGSGTGRVGAELHRRGHEVVGIDLDPGLVDYANATHPGPTWITGDLVDTLELLGPGAVGSFDLVVAAGNVVAFPAPSAREPIMRAFAALLKPDARLVAGFGTGRGYSLADYEAHARAAGFGTHQVFSTWDARPATNNPDYVVSVMTKDGTVHVAE